MGQKNYKIVIKGWEGNPIFINATSKAEALRKAREKFDYVKKENFKIINKK